MCDGLHNASLIIFDYELDEIWLKCKDCGMEFYDDIVVNQALLIALQTRFRQPIEEPPSRDRPEDN